MIGENTYILYDETKEAIIIDPGNYDIDEHETITDFINTNGLSVKFIVNTHCHVDHVLGINYLKSYYDIPLIIHPIEEQVLRAVINYAPNWGFIKYSETSADSYIEENDLVKFGNSSLKVIFVPGHSPGHIVLYNEEQKFCIGGDVLFQRSIGRTDLPGGDHKTLINGIQKKLFSLPDEVTVYPGHGGPTTIGEEKRLNPFCRIV
jgi:glyoxylase-like metal-dependent hydrolase (beta-lactamase superfamily II)